jgi:hypothetical protein
LLHGITGGDAITGLLPAPQAEMPRRSQPIGQDGKCPSAGVTDTATHPNAFVPVIVGLAGTPPMADDRMIEAQRTPPRQAVQGDHPGSLLSFASGSAIKRITVGVKARR